MARPQALDGREDWVPLRSPLALERRDPAEGGRSHKKACVLVTAAEASSSSLGCHIQSHDACICSPP